MVDKKFNTLVDEAILYLENLKFLYNQDNPRVLLMKLELLEKTNGEIHENVIKRINQLK